MKVNIQSVHVDADQKLIDFIEGKVLKLTSQYDKIIDVPFLSGCFLFCRTDVFIKIGGFDDNLFLYMEDVDLIRRFISFGKRAVIYPFVFAIHDHEFKKINNLNTFKIFFKSAFYYFNKWGWILDEERKRLNSNTLNQINKSINCNQ
jgi:GT2 family glycosyltransferase